MIIHCEILPVRKTRIFINQNDTRKVLDFFSLEVRKLVLQAFRKV